MKKETVFQNLWDPSKAFFKREVYNDIGLPQEIRKISNKQPSLIPKRTRKRGINKPQNQQKEGNHKIRAEINEIET